MNSQFFDATGDSRVGSRCLGLNRRNEPDRLWVLLVWQMTLQLLVVRSVSTVDTTESIFVVS